MRFNVKNFLRFIFSFFGGGAGKELGLWNWTMKQFFMVGLFEKRHLVYYFIGVLFAKENHEDAS